MPLTQTNAAIEKTLTPPMIHPRRALVWATEACLVRASPQHRCRCFIARRTGGIPP